MSVIDGIQDKYSSTLIQHSPPLMFVLKDLTQHDKKGIDVSKWIMDENKYIFYSFDNLLQQVTFNYLVLLSFIYYALRMCGYLKTNVDFFG